MKNNEEFRKAVFEKAAAYEKNRKIKRGRILRTAVALAVCLLFVPFAVYFPIGLSAGSTKTIGHSVITSATPLYAMTTGCAAGTGCTNTPVSESYRTTTEYQTTAESRSTTVLGTTSTTAAYSTAVSPNIGVKEEGEFEKIYFNGAFSVESAYSSQYEGAFETQMNYSAGDELSEYFDEAFFEENALITIKFNAEGITPYFADVDVSKNGDIRVYLSFVYKSGDTNGASSWFMMIPVSKALVEDNAEIKVFVTESFE